MKECFENENLYILIFSIIVITIGHIITSFKYWGYITIKRYENSANEIIQNIITKKYYKVYSDYGCPIHRKKELPNYKLK